MDANSLGMFKRELEKQCTFALMAYDDLNETLRALRSKKAQREDVERIWSSIHSFLVAAGNISKIFWPKRNSKYSDRGDALRNDLSIKDDSPVSWENRGARNYLEHFDEYLEEWIELKRPRYADISFGEYDEAKAKRDGLELIDFLRYFDCKAFRLLFSGEWYELEPIVRSIRELLEKVKR